VPGFPIRTSTDQRLVDSFPWLFAVAHVLHRFETPRHPPLALYSLEEQLTKDARARSAILKGQVSECGSAEPVWARRRRPTAPSKQKRGLRPRSRLALGARKLPPSPCGNEATSAPTWDLPRVCRPCGQRLEEQLLRKEVIQPHLPVRLPCYDFTPITDPTFDGSLSYELGYRLRVLPTFVV
jgi:hypothetical protein